MSTRTPLRHARAAALHNHLASRADCIDQFVEALPATRQDNARAALRCRSTAAGIYGALFMLGGPVSETGLDVKVYDDWAKLFVELDALNVSAVIRHLTREAGWKTRDVEVALNDLAGDEAIRLVAEPDSGEVGIELLRRPGDHPATEARRAQEVERGQ